METEEPVWMPQGLHLSLVFILLGLLYVEDGWLGTVGRDYFRGAQKCRTAPLFVIAQTNITTAA